MAVCTANTRMAWPPVKEIVDKIDDLAATLQTPDYEDLVEDERRPFKFDDKQDNITFYQAFTISADGNGGGLITARYLSTDPYGNNPYTAPDEVLKNMAEDEDLFFVSEEDDCLCATVFAVVLEGDNLTLKTAPQKGCCQSLEVPETGDALPGTQYIIPHNKLKVYLESGNPEDGEINYDGDRCHEMDDGVGFQFVSADAESLLKTATRKFTGYFTWMAREDYFATMWDKIEYILQCHHNDGSDASVWWDYIEGDYRDTQCSPNTHDILSTLMEEGSISATPGCLFESNAVVYPWEESTCSGELCDGAPKFYCNTLIQMEELLDKASDEVRPYKSTAFRGCCCTAEKVEDLYYGESTVCAPWKGTGLLDGSPPDLQCWVISRTLTTVCTWKEKDGSGNFTVNKSNTSVYTVETSGEVVKSEDADEDCMSGYVTEDSRTGDTLPPNAADYEDYECDTTSEREYTTQPDPEDLAEKAIEEAIANGGPEDSICAVGISNWEDAFGNSTPCTGGKAYAFLGKYKITVSPAEGYESLCNGLSPSGSISGVEYDLVLRSGGSEISREKKTITCNWDAGENKFISAPQSYPSTELVTFGYSIDFGDDYNAGVLCVNC